MKLISLSYRLASGCATIAIAAGLTSAAAANDGNFQTPSKYANVFLSDIEATEYSEIKAEPGVNGEVELVRERYKDGKTRIERQVALNGDGNYVNHGAWKLYSPVGDVVAEGQYNFGQRVGMWTRWIGRNDSPMFNEFPFKTFKAPFMSQVNFTEGKMDGDWIITDANDRKVALVSLKAGQRNGLTTTWLPTGKVFHQMTYNESVPVGDLLETNTKTGELTRTATFEEGRKVVTKKDYYPGRKQLKSEIMYLAAKSAQQTADDYWTTKLAKYVAEGKDLRHGSAKTWFANGKPQQDGYYQNDQKSGTFTFWHANGQVASTGDYRDDQAEGNWVWWYDNGQKSSVGKYQQGTLIGEWRWWDEEGKLTKQETYDGTESASTDSEERVDVSKRAAKATRR